MYSVDVILIQKRLYIAHASMKFCLKNKIKQSDSILFSSNDRIHWINKYILNIVTVLNFCNSCDRLSIFFWERHNERRAPTSVYLSTPPYVYSFSIGFFADDLFFFSWENTGLLPLNPTSSDANRKAIRNDILNNLLYIYSCTILLTSTIGKYSRNTFKIIYPKN